MEKSFPLDELINIDKLQSIQDSFARAAGISSVIISPEGEPLTRFTNLTGFCSLIQSTGKGKERCFKSFMEMGKIALVAQEPELCYCFAHSGNFVAPIMIDGEHKGTMFAGQFTPEKFSCEQLHNLKKIAHEIDLDPGLLVKEAEKMRVVGEDVIRNYSSLLFKVVETIAKIGAQAAELEKRVQERIAEIAEANKELEHEIVERKHTEQKLRKLDQAIKKSPEGISIADLEGRFVFVNPAWAKMHGYRVANLIGKPATMLDTPESRKNFPKILEEIKKKSNWRGELQRVRKDGSSFPATMTSSIVTDGKDKQVGIVGTCMDITEQKAAQEAIRESEERYRSLFEFGMDGILIADIETKRLEYANPAICKMLGYSAEELEGMSVSDIHPKDNFEHVISEFEAQARGEKTLAHDIPCLRKSGTIIYADINTTSASVDGKRCNIGFFRDNTEGKKAEQALRESEEKMRMITASANDAILMIDHKGNISYWNKSAERMFGYAEGEVIGKDLHALLVPERFHAGFSKGFEGFKKTGQGAALGKTLEMAAIGKDGKEFPVELSLSAVKLKDRWNAIGLTRDISERKAVEEEIKEKADELESFNKLAVGRELKMIELKKEINALLEKSGKKPGYKIVEKTQAEVF